MLTYTATAETLSELIAKMLHDMGFGAGSTISAAVVPPAAVDTPPAASTQATEAAKVEQPAASRTPGSEIVAQIKRGRPRKSVTPVEGAVPVATVTDGSTTQAAVVENTASGPAASPSVAEGAQPPPAREIPVAGERPGEPAVAETPDPVLYQPTRAALQEAMERFEDQMRDGCKAVHDIIAKHGFEKVNQMKGGVLPSVSAAIIAEAAAVKGDK